MGTRAPGKAGSWYPRALADLDDQLNGYLAAVPDTIDGSPLPIAGARIVIAP